MVSIGLNSLVCKMRLPLRPVRARPTRLALLDGIGSSWRAKPSTRAPTSHGWADEAKPVFADPPGVNSLRSGRRPRVPGSRPISRRHAPEPFVMSYAVKEIFYTLQGEG